METRFRKPSLLNQTKPAHVDGATRQQLRVLSVLAVIALLFFSANRPAHAATFTVNSTADAVDTAPGNGVCADASGHCTLRAAIMEANALPGADTITLPPGTYTLTIPGAGEDAAATGDLDITGDLTINGAGALFTTINGNSIDRVFDVLAGAVTISGLTVRGGWIFSEGGGVKNDGALTLSSVTVSGNVVQTSGLGGGIINHGTLTLVDCTVSGNLTGGAGGGIANTGVLTVINSTVSGNTGSSTGGIFNLGGDVTLTNSTVSGNSGAAGSGIRNYPGVGTVKLKNTIVANSTFGANCDGTVTSLGHNLSSDNSCSLTAPTDLPNTPPQLGALANNGGPTETHALLPGSPAIDAVPLASCTVSTDQRGVLRPQGAACDIGAFEAIVIPTYSVTYNGNGSTGGSVPIDGNAYVAGATVTVLGNTGSLVKTGYIFAGWNTLANGSGTSYAGGATFAMGSGNVTLYAQWTLSIAPACAPPPSGMVAWWPMDETAGATSLQDIIGGNNATPFAPLVGAAQAPQSVPGEVSGAIDFPKFGNGLSGARVSPQGALATIGVADLTIDAWVQVPRAPADQPHYVVNKFDAAQNRGYALYVVSPGVAGNEQLEFKWGDGSNTSTVQSISPIAPNQWQHVAVTFARSVAGFGLDIRLYVNGIQQGVQVGNPPNLGSLVNFIFLEIGWQPSTVDEPIIIDELEIFNRALGPQDIFAIFNSGSAGKCKCVQPPSGMVSWWPADGNASDIADGNNGMLKGNAAFVPGMAGPAFSFAAQGDYVEVSNAANLNVGPAGSGGDLSIDAWIKTRSTAQVVPIVDKRDLPGGASGTQSTGYALFLFNGKLAFQLGDGTFFNYISSGPDLRDGVFHHVAVTVDRSSATGGNLYVNGVVVLPSFDPTNRPGSLTNNKPLLIGQHAGDPTITFIGLIDEVEVFNRALGLQDILDIFSAGSAGKCKPTCVSPPSGMEAWYPLDEGVGATSVADFSGNGHNGTPQPGPVGMLGGPMPNVPNPPAVVGGSLDFFSGPSALAYVTVPDTPPLSLDIGSGDFTIDGWVYDNGGPAPIVDKFDATLHTGYRLYLGAPFTATSATLYFSYGDGSTSLPVQTVQSILPISFHQWHYVAVTVKRSSPPAPYLEVLFYIDGTSQGGQSVIVPVGIIANTLELFIGGFHPPPPATGATEIAIDELELFHRALSQTEIQGIFSAGSAGKCKCLLVSNAKISCNPNGTFTYTFTVTNLSTSTVSGVTVSPQAAAVTVTPGSITGLSLPPGGSTTATVTISGPGAASGATICFTVVLVGQGAVICRTTDHCIRLPRCPRHLPFY
jgi:CSLREA domain-containing protein/uncharacterized repeat protein (TIGR02543 family)